MIMDLVGDQSRTIAENLDIVEVAIVLITYSEAVLYVFVKRAGGGAMMHGMLIAQSIADYKN